MARLPAGFLEELIEGRAYARYKAMLDAADSPQAFAALPDGPLMDLVKAITADLAHATDD